MNKCFLLRVQRWLLSACLWIDVGASALGQTRWTNHYPAFLDIAASPTTYVVAGDSPMVSYDLVQWTPTGAVRSNAWTGIVYAQEKFVAVSQNGELAISTDGKKWTYCDLRPLLPLPQDDVRYRGIEFLDGNFLVLARGILVSTNALNWEVRAKAQDYESYSDVAYGNGTYLAVGNRGTVALSTNGRQWSLSRPFGGVNLVAAVYFKERFYVINVYRSLYTSADGNSWSNVGNLPGYSLFASEHQLLSVGADGVLLRTSNGTTWDTTPTPSRYISRLAYVNGRYFALGAAGVLLSSPDTLNWLTSFTEAETRQRLISVAANGTNRIALGREGAFLHSTAGGAWNNMTRPDSAWFYSVASFQDKFVAAGWEGKVYTSAEGQNWSAQESGTTNALFNLSVANNRIFAGGYGFVLSSTNATNWQAAALHTNLAVSGVLFGNGRYVAAGWRISSGEGTGLAAASQDAAAEPVPAVMTSTDLQQWSPIMEDFGTFYCAAYGNGIFLLAGTRVAISKDGLQWTNVDPAEESFEDAIFANGKFYLASYPGVLFMSADGVNWSTIACGTSYRLWGLGVSHSSLIAVGEIGTIVEAPFDLYFGPRRKTLQGDRQMLHGASGGLLKIESSADLRNWSDYLDISNPTNPYEFSPGASTPMFFRAHQSLPDN